jgi:small multidrug resistance pump
MRVWILLAIAIVTEVAASLSLKAAAESPWLYVVVIVGYLTGIVLLQVILRLGAPLGVVYGIWAACGVALTAAFSAVVFHEQLSLLQLLGIGLIVGGVLLVELGAQAAERKRRSR